MSYTKTINLMGTEISLTLEVNKISTVLKHELFNIFETEFNRIVNKFTRFSNSSELSKLNFSNGIWFTVCPEMFFLVKYMYELHLKTEGVFDPSVIDYLEIYGYTNASEVSNLEQKEITRLIKKRSKVRPKFKNTQFLDTEMGILLPSDCRIDLGAIGKGYAIDCAHAKLLEICTDVPFLINAGGDIRVHSSPQKQTWQISLKDKANIIGFIELSNDDSICSSGSWIKKLGKMHHLINPKLGISMDINRTVFCKAKSAMIADAWASIIFLSGDKYVDKELDITYHIIKN